MQSISKEIIKCAEDLFPEGTIEVKLKKLIENEIIRRLTHYQHIVHNLEKKYRMDFKTFQDKDMVKQLNYSLEVENDLCEWEMALDGIKTLKKRLDEIRKGLNENKRGQRGSC